MHFEVLLCNAVDSIEICTGGLFVKDCFYCYSQEILSVVANEFLISYNLIKRAPENRTFNAVQFCLKTNTSQFLEQKILFHTNTNNKSTGKIVCKIQYLKMACNSMYRKAQ